MAKGAVQTVTALILGCLILAMAATVFLWFLDVVSLKPVPFILAGAFVCGMIIGACNEPTT